MIVSAFGTYPLLTFASDEVIHGVSAGIVLSVLNVMLGYAAIEYSTNKSYSHFVQVVLGGIAIRLVIIAGSLLMLILFFKVHPVSLVSSLFGMYVIFLALEVLYIHNTWQKKIDVQNLK